MEFIDEFVFETDYKPLPNPTDGGQTWEHRDTLAYPVEQVWTLVDGDDGGIWAVPGYHIVNKIDYVVTEKPWSDPGLDAVWVDADDLGGVAETFDRWTQAGIGAQDEEEN